MSATLEQLQRERDALLALFDRQRALDELSPAARALEEREIARELNQIRNGQLPLIAPGGAA